MRVQEVLFLIVIVLLWAYIYLFRDTDESLIPTIVVVRFRFGLEIYRGLK